MSNKTELVYWSAQIGALMHEKDLFDIYCGAHEATLAAWLQKMEAIVYKYIGKGYFFTVFCWKLYLASND